LILAGCQLRVPEREVPRGLIDLFVERVVERLQLIEHLVQAGGDGSKLVIVADRRPENEYRLSEIWESSAEGFALPERSGVPQLGRADVRPAASEARTIVFANWI